MTETLAPPDAPRCILTGARAYPSYPFSHRLTNFCRAVEAKLRNGDEAGLTELAQGVPSEHWVAVLSHARSVTGVAAPTASAAPPLAAASVELAELPVPSLDSILAELDAPAAPIAALDAPAASAEEATASPVEEQPKKAKRGR